LKMQKPVAVGSAIVLCCIALSGAAFGQAMQKQYVADFGGAFTQATVTKARMGFAGIDLQVGKMLTNNLSVGLSTGCDVVSFRKAEGIYERLMMVPILAKARYYVTIAPAMQLYASAAGGIYQSIPHLSIDPIGDIWKAETDPGGAAAIGFSYWFLGTQGVGAEFEYHFLDSGGESLFSYFAIRLNYSLIKM
jgi:hypothetical protein